MTLGSEQCFKLHLRAYAQDWQQAFDHLLSNGQTTASVQTHTTRLLAQFMGACLLSQFFEKSDFLRQVYEDIVHASQDKSSSSKDHVNAPDSQLSVLQATLAQTQLMAGSLAHEQKNYLTAITMTLVALQSTLTTLITADQPAIAAELIKAADTTLPDRMAQQIKRLSQYVDKASQMIKLQLSAITQHQGHIDTANFKVCSINATIKAVLDCYPFDKGERDLVNWQSGIDFNFMGDLLLSQQVVWNLLNNALCAIKAAGSGKITLWTEDKPKRLYIEDSGPGISPALIPQLFTPGVSKRSGGHGLGLAFCKAVLQASGADIHCESELGQYTRFVLSFSAIEHE